MASLVGSALRARRTQTVAVFVLTVLAGLGASAAPWFVHWAQDAVAASDIAAAPVSQRVVTLSGSADYQAGGVSPLSLVRDQVIRSLSIPGSQTTVGARLLVNVESTTVPSHPTVGLALAARDDVCAHLVIDGACPTVAGTVVIGRSTAAALSVHIGDPVVIVTARVSEQIVLRVTGIYDARDVLSPYWAGTQLLGGPTGLLATRSQPAAFVSESTLLGIGSQSLDVDGHVVLPPTAFHDSGAGLRAGLKQAGNDLGPQGFGLATDAYGLISQLRLDQRLVRSAVLVAVVELVLLSWFALFLAVRQTSVVRRLDIGLLKLRGAPRWQIWLLTGQQSAIPMLAGVVVGGLGGYLAASALAGSASALRPVSASTVETSVLVAVLAGGGALIAAVAAEWSVLRSSVLTLLRRVPTRRSGWRAPAGDLAVVALALAGVYQGYADVGANGEPSTLALLAPGLVGLAVALVLARAMPWLAVRAGSGALTAGHAGGALGALHMARRPGTERVFAVVALAVSVLTSSLFFAANARDAWHGRAELQLGAARVLEVRAPSSTALRTAVRTVDPDGRYAMAVARAAISQTVAGDTPRLAAVALIPGGYGLPDGADLARLLRPAAPSQVTLRDGTLSLDIDGPDPTGPGSVDPAGVALPVILRILDVDPAGVWHPIEIGPLTAGRHTYTTTISGCTNGCRLISFEPLTDRPEATVGLRGLSQAGTGDEAGGPLLDAAVLGDISRWRSQLSPDGIGPTIATGDGALDITVTATSPPTGLHLDNRVFYSGTPVPVPVALAGPAPDERRDGDPRITILGTDEVPYHPVATGLVLPGLGANGGLMDLEYAENSLSSASEAVSLEVWLTADAPPSIVDGLKSRGIGILTDSTLASVTGLWAAEGPGLALRFQLFAAVVVLLLAAGALIVSSTVERRDRSRELSALRNQGMSERAMRFAGYVATVLVVAGAVLTGFIAALIAQGVVTASLPVFTDQWAVLPHRTGAAPIPSLLGLGLAALVLVPVAVLGAARLVRSVRRQTGAAR